LKSVPVSSIKASGLRRAGGRPIAHGTAQVLRAADRLPEEQDVALPLMIPLGMEMVDIVAQCPPQRALAEEDDFGQALLLTDLTQRSAWAFRFGLRAGSASGSTRPDATMARNDRVNLVSRSCRR
jgi:hypothetical protein